MSCNFIGIYQLPGESIDSYKMKTVTVKKSLGQQVFSLSILLTPKYMTKNNTFTQQ